MKFSAAAIVAFVAAASALPQGTWNPPPPPSDPQPPFPDVPFPGQPTDPSRPDTPPFNPGQPDHRPPPPPPQRNNGFNLRIYRSGFSGWEGKPLIVNGDTASGLNFLQPGDFAETFQFNSGFLFYGGEANSGSLALFGGQSSLARGRGFTPFVMANSNGGAWDRRGLSFWNNVSVDRNYGLTVRGRARWALCQFNGQYSVAWMDDNMRGDGRDGCYSVSIVQTSPFNGGPGPWRDNAKKTEGKKLPITV